MITAFVDESARHHDNGDHCVYVLAAALVDERHADALTTVVEKHRPGGAVKLHWRDQTVERKAELTADLAEVPLAGVVVVHFYGYRPDNERARGLCFNRLLSALPAEHAVDAVMLESQGRRDEHDQGLLTTLRKLERVPRDLRVKWIRGRDEALLWVADALAGAVMMSFGPTPEDRVHLERYGERVQLIDA